MNDLLKKIYNNVLVYEKDTVKISKEVDTEILLLLQPYKFKLTDDELEELKSLMSAVSLTAEQAGFEIGVRYTLRLLYNLFS